MQQRATGQTQTWASASKPKALHMGCMLYQASCQGTIHLSALLAGLLSALSCCRTGLNQLKVVFVLLSINYAVSMFYTSSHFVFIYISYRIHNPRKYDVL